jgi:hypothetical protein
MAQELIYKDTGFRYVKGQSGVLFSNGILLKMPEFEKLDTEGKVIFEILRRAKTEEKYDYAYAVQEGILRLVVVVEKEPEPVPIVAKPKPKPKKRVVKAPTLEKLVKPVEPPPVFESVQEYEAEISVEEVEAKIEEIMAAENELEIIPETDYPVEEEQAASTEAELPGLDNSSAGFVPPFTAEVKPEPALPPQLPYWQTVPFILAIVIGLVAAGSAVMSSYHTIGFQQGVLGRPYWAAIFIGVIFILFSSAMLTAARYFLAEPGAVKILGIIILIMGLGVIAVSMFSTMGISHTQFAWRDKEAMQTVVEANVVAERSGAMVDLLRDREAWLANEIERLDSRISHENAEAARYAAMDPPWTVSRNRHLSAADLLEAERREHAVDLRSVRETLLEQTVVGITAEGYVKAERGDIFTLTARLLSVDEELLMFLIYAITACFFDIAAPFGAMIVLYLREKLQRRTV